MGLSKTVNVTVYNYTVKLSEELKFYQNDKMKLSFVIRMLGDVTIDPIKSYLLLENPKGVDKIESMEVGDNVFSYYIDSKHTKYLGVSKMQIVLVDAYGGQMTLPQFNFEVRENIYGDIQTSELPVSTTNDEVLLTDDDDMIIGEIVFE